MRRARTVEEYVAWVKDALYELDDIMGASRPYMEEIESSLKNIFKLMESYISVIRDLDEHTIPFRQLLIRINDTHKQGLETDEEQN